MAKKIVHSAANAGDRCRNCGHALNGPYCAACGQAEHDGHPPTLGHFFHDLVHEFLHVDGKIFLTLKALLFQPGKLTEEYWAGRVASWVRPIRIFLIVVALQALVSQGQGPLNHKILVGRSSSGSLSVNIASDVWRLEEENAPVSDEELSDFSHKFEKTYGALRYSSVLVFALVAWWLYRRPQPYFVNHLIGGLHFYSFWYALALLADLLARTNPIWTNLPVLSTIYLFLALLRLFHERWYVAMMKTAVIYLVVFSTEFGLGYIAAKWIER